MQIIINGIVSGSAIAMLALAFQAVYLPTRVFFIGMSGVYSITPFVALSILVAGGPLWVAGVASVMVAVFICLACESLIHAPLERRRAGGGAHLIASLGYSIIIVQIISMIWGNNKQVLRTGTSSTSQFGDVIISDGQWIILGFTSTAIATFFLILMRANLGLRLRALADNPTQFALFGYNINYHRLLSFGLAGFLTAVASLVTAYDVGFDMSSGLNRVLLAIVAVVIGGQSSFAGPVLSGLLLGVIRSQVVWYWEARWEEPVTFLLLALVLLLLPQGLLGRTTRLETNS